MRAGCLTQVKVGELAAGHEGRLREDLNPVAGEADSLEALGK